MAKVQPGRWSARALLCSSHCGTTQATGNNGLQSGQHSTRGLVTTSSFVHWLNTLVECKHLLVNICFYQTRFKEARMSRASPLCQNLECINTVCLQMITFSFYLRLKKLFFSKLGLYLKLQLKLIPPQLSYFSNNLVVEA